MAHFPLAMAQMNPPPTATARTTNTANEPANQQRNLPFSAGRWFDPARTEEIIRDNGGYELVISPLYKRFLAEVIDTVILFIVKILVFVVIMDFFDIHV
jgi:hypothetical protein